MTPTDLTAEREYLIEEWKATCAANPRAATPRESAEAIRWAGDYIKRNGIKADEAVGRLNEQ
jgi:uncharacterized protein YchJ